jgi:cytochrome c
MAGVKQISNGMNYRNCHLDAGAAGKQLWFGIFDVSKK